MPPRNRPPADVDEDQAIVDRVGRTLRAVRTERGLSAAELARRSGVSQPFISQVEHGKFAPSLVTLQRLADALEVPASVLLGEPGEPLVVRAGHGAPIAHADVEDTPIAHRLSSFGGALEVLHYVTSPGEDDDPDARFTHPGEDFVYVLRGEVEIDIGDEAPVRLGAGDSMHFRGDVPHRQRTVGAEESEFLVVVTQG